VHSVIILRLICVQEFLSAVAGMKLPPFLSKADPKQAGCGSNTTHHRHGAADLHDSRTLVFRGQKYD
jgi:hypothetical protein